MYSTQLEHSILTAKSPIFKRIMVSQVLISLTFPLLCLSFSLINFDFSSHQRNLAQTNSPSGQILRYSSIQTSSNSKGTDQRYISNLETYLDGQLNSVTTYDLASGSKRPYSLVVSTNSPGISYRPQARPRFIPSTYEPRTQLAFPDSSSYANELGSFETEMRFYLSNRAASISVAKPDRSTALEELVRVSVF